jgi:hypothetical protein
VSQDFTKDLIWSALRNFVKEQIQAGVSVEEIEAQLTDGRVETATVTVAEKIVQDCLTGIHDNMYEAIMWERSNAAQFMVHNEQLWQPGFAASDMMYLMVLEAAEAYSKLFDELPDEQKQSVQYRYIVLKELHGRALQEFLEILWLLKGGFADGAYARWRSMYELSVVAEFIKQNGEIVAQAYYKESAIDQKEYNWAKTATCFENNKSVSFNMIQRQCDIVTKQWEKQYRLSNKVLHAAPQGTFDRIGKPSEVKVVSVGRSDYCIEMPAVNSAITLAIISSNFFTLLPSYDGAIYANVIAKWVDTVREYYISILNTCFERKDAENIT